MAFFGLTALGPQNSFESNSTTFRYIQVFDEDDFKSAWAKVNGPEAQHTHKEKLAAILKALFHGPIPGNEQGPIQEAFENGTFETPETISLDSYMKIMLRLRNEAEEDAKRREGKPNPNCEFNSTSELALALKKNAAMKRELQTKLTTPLTATQEVTHRQNSVPIFLCYTLYSIFSKNTNVNNLYFVYTHISSVWVVAAGSEAPHGGPRGQ